MAAMSDPAPTPDKKPATPDQIDALKLMGEWCKWLVTIETAAIAGIGAFLKLDAGQVLTNGFRYSCATAVISFVVSIVLSAWLMVCLPTSIQDIQPGEKIWDRPAIVLWLHVPFWVVAYVQFGAFIVGIVAFAVGAAGRLWL